MVRPSCKDLILDAAEEVLMDRGAWRFTLDAVAKQASVSKGGVLYHFPSKDVLIQELVERLLERGAERKQEFRDASGNTPQGVLQADIKAGLLKEDYNPRLGAALIAALANCPELAAPIRAFHEERFRELESLPVDTDLATILFLAADGLMLTEKLNVSPFTESRRAELVEALFAMAQRLAETPSEATPT